MSGIYLESVFLARGTGTENIAKTREQTGKKNENEEKGKWRIQGNSNNNDERLWFYFCIKNYILLENIVWKNSLHHHILFTVFMSCRIFVTQ